MARELHDVVAHSMSVMVVQAGAARQVLDRSPEEAIQALRTVETTGRETLEELRRLLGILRPAGQEPELEPAPQVRDLDDARRRRARDGAEGRPARRRRSRGAPGLHEPHAVPHRPGGADERAAPRG